MSVGGYRREVVDGDGKVVQDQAGPVPAVNLVLEVLHEQGLLW